jgi:hypothetical protein
MRDQLQWLKGSICETAERNGAVVVNGVGNEQKAYLIFLLQPCASTPEFVPSPLKLTFFVLSLCA